MKKLIFALFLVSTAAVAEDSREAVRFTPQAQATLSQEMRDNLVALHEVLNMLAAGQPAIAGEIAEAKLGVSAMGKHRLAAAEARPGPQMPAAMHAMGVDGHKAASEFASVAKTGDRDKALAMLPKLTGSCVACHASYRVQ